MRLPVTALHALYLALAFVFALLAARPVDAAADAVMRIGFGPSTDQAVGQTVTRAGSFAPEKSGFSPSPCITG